VIKEKRNEPDKIIRVCGHEFRLYKEYDEGDGLELLIYPEFDENPEYTEDNRPFALRVDDSCEYGRCSTPDGDNPGDCGGCVFFYREQPDDPIGICMCDERRQNYRRTN